MPLKQRKKQPFRIFEAGSGILPKAIIKRAAKSKNKNRAFVGTDKEMLPKWMALLFSGRLRKPANLELQRADSLKALRSLAPGSQSIIFASYFLNNLSRPEDIILFFRLAKKAIKTNGRVVIAQDKHLATHCCNIARNSGFVTTVFEIPDAKAKKSFSSSIRERATPRKRRSYVAWYEKKFPGSMAEAQKMVLTGQIKSLDDYAKPVMLVMQKKR